MLHTILYEKKTGRIVASSTDTEFVDTDEQAVIELDIPEGLKLFEHKVIDNELIYEPRTEQEQEPTAEDVLNMLLGTDPGATMTERMEAAMRMREHIEESSQVLTRMSQDAVTEVEHIGNLGSKV